MNLEQVEINYSPAQEVKQLVPKQSNININKNKLIAVFENGTKRFVDIIGGIVGIIILIPLTIGVYIARKILKEDDGPLFYDQLRIGKDGKIFKMYKFRTMVIGADEKLFKYLEENEEAREEYRINKKLKNDPRVTKLGKILRKTSIDEFPQFINVLKGEMSLVGPRPYLPREKEDMGDSYEYIIKTKPGITGFWQVNGRSDVTFEKRLNMDLDYYKEKSLKLDIKLLAKTITNVMKKEGAA